MKTYNICAKGERMEKINETKENMNGEKKIISLFFVLHSLKE